MARPTHASIEIATTERLLRAAERHFASHGLERARLEDIARDAGITRASLLYHFSSKDVLHTAVVDQALMSLGAIVASAIEAPGAFPTRADALIESFFTFVEVHPELARIVVRELVAGNERVLKQALPVLDAVTSFVAREHPRRTLAQEARTMLMMIIADAFLRAATGEHAAALWGDRPQSRAVARRLLLGEDT